MDFEGVRNMILNGGRAGIPGDSPPPDIPVVPPGRNAWGVPLLDMRPVTLGVKCGTGDPKIAANAVSYRQDDGTGFLDAPPDSRREIPADLSYGVDGRLLDGVLFAPSEMEHKWAVFFHRGKVLFVRSWLRKVLAVGEVREAGDHVLVHSIRGVFAADDEPPEFTIGVFDFLLRRYALDEQYPAPLPAATERAPVSAALWCLYLYGDRAHYATSSPFPRRSPKTLLRTCSLLHIAAARGDLHRVRALLDAGAPVDVLGRDGLAPMHWALGAGRTGVLDLLLSRGASVDVRSLQGATPLMNAVQSKAPETVAFLLDRGADPNACDSRGFTALHRAAELGLSGIVRLLLGHGASPLVQAQGQTPLSLAERRGEKAVVRLLRSGT